MANISAFADLRVIPNSSQIEIFLYGNCGLAYFCLIVSQVITNIDVQNIEPIDLNMRESLAKSVQMAIEIATR